MHSAQLDLESVHVEVVILFGVLHGREVEFGPRDYDNVVVDVGVLLVFVAVRGRTGDGGFEFHACGRLVSKGEFISRCLLEHHSREVEKSTQKKIIFK